MGKKWNDHPSEECIDVAIDEFLATCFLASSNNAKYGKLKESLKESENLGVDEYPKTISDVFELLMKTSGELESRKESKNTFLRKNRRGVDSTRFAFAQTSISDSNTCPGNNGIVYPYVRCHGFMEMGHFVKNCPNKSE